MKVVAFEMSRHVRILALARMVGQLYLPHAALMVTDRYSFAGSPKTLDDLLRDPIVFRHGKFGESAIDELSIYNDGVSATARASTAFLDDFMEDFLGWAKEQFNLTEVEGMPTGAFYDSQLIARSTKSVDALLSRVALISNLIGEKLASYGQKTMAMSPAGFSLDIDATKVAGRRPLRFLFERRVGAPADSGLYYSIAPLRTADHIEVLDALERLL